uniref:Uncharacterized protein n=1 Tax=Schizaphis graminum TaxID=13262 RepID=A0A2S2PGW6_SCHGA
MDAHDVYDESSVESLLVPFNMLNLNNTDSQIQLDLSEQLRITHDWVSDATETLIMEVDQVDNAIETPMEVDDEDDVIETRMDIDSVQIQWYSLKIMIRGTYTRRRAARIIHRLKRHFHR